MCCRVNVILFLDICIVFVVMSSVGIFMYFFFLMRRRPPGSTQGGSSAASDVYRRQI